MMSDVMVARRSTNIEADNTSNMIEQSMMIDEKKELGIVFSVGTVASLSGACRPISSARTKKGGLTKKTPKRGPVGVDRESRPRSCRWMGGLVT